MISSCTRGGLDFVLGKNFLLTGQSVGTGCPGKWWNCISGHTSLQVFTGSQDVLLREVV